ncbi:hypothetical protein H2201_006849 [Coniosporium apollinis]|uniref:Ca3427-like PBP 2 domain-containing protein n=1 Tax=Coniosporium apollinis TaxID=61459 RepID=A0ABQ9NKX4_9PEZI|nr:hypothetical protein H2201_006849 [Coniosporium apollinis]
MSRTLRSLRPIVRAAGRHNISYGARHMSDDALRIGYVPEHFSTPLYFAHKYYDLNAKLIPFPSGTGHMIQSLQNSEIDVGIGLTEGWVAGLGKSTKSNAPYKLVGTYVESPLCWAISTGSKRDDIERIEQLKHKQVGVSRIGSGSYVMSFVLAEQQGWLKSDGSPPFEPVVLNDFAGLRKGVNEGQADFFMWEHFTSKRYFDNGEIRRIGEIYTPWSSWKIVARDPLDKRMQPMSDAINEGIAHFERKKDESINYISKELDYSAEDAEAWLKTVKFPQDVRGVDPIVIEKTIDTLKKAGVIDAEGGSVDDMVAIRRSSRGKSDGGQSNGGKSDNKDTVRGTVTGF